METMAIRILKTMKPQGNSKENSIQERHGIFAMNINMSLHFNILIWHLIWIHWMLVTGTKRRLSWISWEDMVRRKNAMTDRLDCLPAIWFSTTRQECFAIGQATLLKSQRKSLTDLRHYMMHGKLTGGQLMHFLETKVKRTLKIISIKGIQLIFTSIMKRNIGKT